MSDMWLILQECGKIDINEEIGITTNGKILDRSDIDKMKAFISLFFWKRSTSRLV